jgi:hypothetical protein
MNHHITSATKYNVLEALGISEVELFPRPKRHCDECGCRLSASKRNRVVVRHRQRGVGKQVLAGFELCNRCKRSFESGSVPNIQRTTEAAFLNSLECAGGVQ